MSLETSPSSPDPAAAGHRCLVMGVLNVTPDSFSDGGEYTSVDVALAHGEEMLAQGADIIDVGGQSTRPGAGDLTGEEEWARIGGAVEGLVARGAVVSVDTIHADVAARALEAGVSIINDVSGGCVDPAMGRVVAEAHCLYVCQHWRGRPDVMDQLTSYPQGVVAGVRAELRSQIDRIVDAGVDPGRIVADPGLGFSKTPDQSWELLAHLDVLSELGFPLLVGASRKRFLGSCAAGPLPVDRDGATAAVSALAAAQGAWAVRVHDVAGSASAVAVAHRWKEHA